MNDEVHGREPAPAEAGSGCAGSGCAQVALYVVNLGAIAVAWFYAAIAVMFSGNCFDGDKRRICEDGRIDLGMKVLGVYLVILALTVGYFMFARAKALGQAIMCCCAGLLATGVGWGLYAGYIGL